MKAVAIIQARMKSARLPGKVLMKLKGGSVLSQIVRRIESSKVDGLIVATTTDISDDNIDLFCRNNGIKCYRGSMDDVLGRVAKAGFYMKADTIVDITADCPLIDYRQINKLLDLYNNNKSFLYKYASNCWIRSWPDGFDIQIYSLAALENVSTHVVNEKHRSHAGWNIPYYLKDHGVVDIINDVAPHEYNYPKWGLTLDTQQDYQLISKLYELDMNLVSAELLIEFLKDNPELLKINNSVIRKAPGEG